MGREQRGFRAIQRSVSSASILQHQHHAGGAVCVSASRGRSERVHSRNSHGGARKGLLYFSFLSNNHDKLRFLGPQVKKERFWTTLVFKKQAATKEYMKTLE
ncbi:hypothetical protein SRHO_G00023570 [Serrasalmus rhombeus]